MKKLFMMAVLSVLMALTVLSCSKDEPARDWLDGKTFEYIADLDKPAEQRMANDLTYVFSRGKVTVTHYMEDGYRTDRLYTVVRATVTGDYIYQKPLLMISNVKVTSFVQDYRDGKLISEKEKVEQEEDFIIQVDEKAGVLLFDEGWDPNRIPLKK